MARPSLLRPGATVRGYRVLTLFPAEKGKVRRVSLECVVCTTRRESWANLLLSGRLTCRFCHPLGKEALVPHRTGLFMVLQGEDLVIVNDPPEVGWLWVADRKAIAFTSAGTVAPSQRLPDPRWPVYLIAPALYLPYYLGEPCSEVLHAPALAYLEARLEGVYEEFTIGSTKSWYDEHGNEVCYLYAVNSDAKVLSLEGPSCTL